MVGKQTQTALYVHESAFDFLSDEDQDAIKYAERISRHYSTNVYKLSNNREVVSLLTYFDFDGDGFPTLEYSCTVNLTTSIYSVRSYVNSKNPPILHRKELLVHHTHRKYLEWRNQTGRLEAGGYYDGPMRRLGYKKQWAEWVEKKQKELEQYLTTAN